MEVELRVAAGSSAMPTLDRRTGPRLQTCALMGTCTTQPDPEQERPGPGATQLFVMLTDELGLMEQEADGDGALSISELPKNPFAMYVLLAVNAVRVGWSE